MFFGLYIGKHLIQTMFLSGVNFMNMHVTLVGVDSAGTIRYQKLISNGIRIVSKKLNIVLCRLSLKTYIKQT